MIKSETTAWGLLWRQENEREGYRQHLLGTFPIATTAHPIFQGVRVAQFATRREAREHIKKHYGYIAKRPDLQREPHGWKMPVPVKIKVVVTLA